MRAAFLALPALAEVLHFGRVAEQLGLTTGRISQTIAGIQLPLAEAPLRNHEVTAAVQWRRTPARRARRSRGGCRKARPERARLVSPSAPCGPAARPARARTRH